MGPGEDFWFAFADWAKSMSAEELKEYILHNPEPQEWVGFYDEISAYNQRSK